MVKQSQAQNCLPYVKIEAISIAKNGSTINDQITHTKQFFQYESHVIHKYLIPNLVTHN